jgi:transcription-repair coupling factor (superfamily II helicase)
MGFSPVSTVAEPGDYAIRGGIVDIYPPGPGGPVRLDFFGDVLDGARRFDPVSQRTVEKLTQVEFAPVSEVVLDDAAITRFRQNYRVEFGAAGTDDPLYEAVSAGRKHQGMEHWLPFFHDRLETLFDYLPDAAVMLDDQVTPMRLARWEAVDDAYDARADAMAQKGRMDTVYKPVAPGLSVSGRYRLGGGGGGPPADPAVALAAGAGAGGSGCQGARIGRSFAPERQQEKISLFSALADHIRALRKIAGGARQRGPKARASG